MIMVGKSVLIVTVIKKEMLDCYYKESLELIQDCGFTSMMVLTDQGFIEKDIKNFYKNGDK